MKPADLDLQCFQKRINVGSAGQRLIKKYQQEVNILISVSIYLQII